MRKKFVQTLAARQLEFVDTMRTNEMEFEKSSHQEPHQQQQDGAGEEIIEILDDDQEVELMMERHRKYHPRKYVNLQHPTSKIYYDKIDKPASSISEREEEEQEAEDEDERNQLVIEESSPKELNNNNVSASNNSSGGGREESNALVSVSSFPRSERDVSLLRDYRYRQMYNYNGHVQQNVVANGGPNSRGQQHQHQQRLKNTGQSSSDIPGSMMVSSHQLPAHSVPYQRQHPYDRYVSYDRSTTGNPLSDYRRNDERRIPSPSDSAVAPAEDHGSFLVPRVRKDIYKADKRKSAFSPPHDKEHTPSDEGNILLAAQSLAAPLASESSAVIAPRTPLYYHQQVQLQHAYQQPSTPTSATNNYMALEEWYRSGVPPPHMLTTTDLQSIYYYHYYLNKMAASSAYHHPYRDHPTPVATMPGLGAMSSPGVVAGVAPSRYPPPQYGFAKGDQPALYGAPPPFDYTVYQSVLARNGYSSCPSQTAISLAPTVPSSQPSEILRPTVINRAPNTSTTPPGLPRTVPVNLVRPRVPPAAGLMDQSGFQPAAYRNDREPIILRPIPTTILNYGCGDSGRSNVLTTTAAPVNVSRANREDKPRDTMSSSTPLKASLKAPPRRESSKRMNTTPTASTPNPARGDGKLVVSRPRGRPPGAKNKETSAKAATATVTAATVSLIETPVTTITSPGTVVTTAGATRAETVIASVTSSASAPPATTSSTTSVMAAPATTEAVAKVPLNPPTSELIDQAAINTRVEMMQKEMQIFFDRRRTDVTTTMRLYSVGRIGFAGMLQEMKRHSVIYRDFLQVAFALMRKSGLSGFTREPPVELDFRWKSPPQEFADYFAQNEQCSKAFVAENFNFLVLIVDNLIQQYIEPLEYFLLTYVLGLRAK